MEIEHYKEQFLHLVGEIDSLDLLQWCHDELEGQIGRLNLRLAQGIGAGDVVEVTRGPGQGLRGSVVGRHPEDTGVMMVDLEGVDIGAPVPIPALALRVLAAQGMA
jgi:hypothetical protein